MSGPVLWNIDPDPREGLLSLVVRTAARNLLPSAYTIIQQVGAAHAHNPMVALDPDLNPETLAWIVRQPEEEVARRWHRPAGIDGFVDSFGCAVRADEIGFRSRRFGPSATRDAPVARALWSLKTVPCCTEHWEYLVDTCACGTVQRWQSADRLDRCDACNAPLADAPTMTVDASLRDDLGFIVGLLDPDPTRRASARAQLPATLADLDGGLILELALAIMPFAGDRFHATRGSLPANSAEQIRYAAALAATADLLRGWPHSFDSAVEDTMGAIFRSRAAPGRMGLAHHMPAMASPILPPAVRQVVLKALAPLTSQPGETPDDQIGMKVSQHLLGIELDMLARARRERTLRTRVCLRGGRFYPALDRAEIEHIHDVKDNRISVEEASRLLDLPKYAMLLIAAANHITLEAHPFLYARYAGPQLHRNEFERFRNDLRARATVLVMPEDDADQIIREALQHPVALHRVARSMGGGLKPWGTIVSLLLDGSVPFAMADARMSRIWLAEADAATLRTMEIASADPPHMSPTCSQRDALEILNLPNPKATLLRTVAKADDGWEMKWGDVLALAAARVTLTELSARTGMHSRPLQTKLEGFALPVDDFGWRREEALRTLDAFETPQSILCRTGKARARRQHASDAPGRSAFNGLGSLTLS